MTLPNKVGMKNCVTYVSHEMDFVTIRKNIVVDPAMM